MTNTIRTQGSFYTRYRAANPSFSEATFQCAHDTVTALVTTITTSENPGMLLGKVQSGKTRTFITVLALSFDNNFDIAIVLSKNSKALVEQTRKRLGDEFGLFVNNNEVDIYDIMSAPKHFSRYEFDELKLIFVAKKQDDNLRRLIDLFSHSPEMAAKRTIIIDDEADSASVGYSKRGDVIEANKIATRISDLRSVLKAAAFLQVTATPYSLYLQPSEVEVENVLEFKPLRPAFTKLVPVPQDYVGGETYFGAASRSEPDTVEKLIHYAVDHRELERLKKPDRRSFSLPDALTAKQIEGYRTAIVTFLVGGSIQRLNGVRAGVASRKLRYSFLLHSEAGIQAHDWQETLTDKILELLRESNERGDGRFVSLATAAYEDLSRSLRLAYEPIPPLSEVLIDVGEALRGDQVSVTKVNSEDNIISMLDSSGQLKLRTPFNIFIGGQVLDRGITLANLIGFYYGRRPQTMQQDTVLQHSRMYGYRRGDLAVTRFYTSRLIRQAMAQMEDFDSSLRAAIEAGGDKAVQFIRMAGDGRIVPCSPNKIRVSTTHTLRPNKRILPIGFQSGYKSRISKAVEWIDAAVSSLCGYNSAAPTLVDLRTAVSLLRAIEKTLEFPDGEATEFDWDAAEAALTHLSQQHPDKSKRGQVWMWAANERNSARLASESSHATYIETPDSEKTEGQIAKKYAIDQPILFLLRQNGSEEKGWRGAPFYWPVIRAQQRTPIAIYAAETID